MLQVNYTKAQQKTSYFNRNRIFTINKRVLTGNNAYYYWLKENGQEVKNRSLREELFALNSQFEQTKMEPIFMYFTEIVLDENNKFQLDFSQTNQIYVKYIFHPRRTILLRL